MVNPGQSVLTRAFEPDVLRNVLGRKAPIAKANVLGEIKRLREKAAKPH
ncbi:MAG: hypothetical protein ACREKF_08005 [Candidatus Methylomirabilales bacterium]